MIAFKALILSDTHGSATAWNMVKNMNIEYDAIYHVGDVLYHGPRNPLPKGYNPALLAKLLKSEPISYVRGNCDADVDLVVLESGEMPRISICTFGKHKAVFVHGDELRNDKDRIGLLLKHCADILIYGHSHVPRLESVSGKIILNPGSLSLPKNSSEATFATLQFESNKLCFSIRDLHGNVLKELNL